MEVFIQEMVEEYTYSDCGNCSSEGTSDCANGTGQ